MKVMLIRKNYFLAVRAKPTTMPKENKERTGFLSMTPHAPTHTILTDPQRAIRLRRWRLPLFTSKIAAGFPSPADDYVEKNLDLNELLITQPAATFFGRAEGVSMIGAGIFPNDILVINRAIEPTSGKIVICALNGELTVKRLTHDGEIWILKAENPAYPDIPIHEELEMVIWGVVTHAIHTL
jgi:DNA polymerase V